MIKTLSENNKVIIGVTNLNAAFFQKLFPTHQQILLPSYNIRYSKMLPVWLSILLQSPNIKAVIKAEHELLKQLIKQHNIDLIVSDNRFGLYNQNIESIFITHQLTIKSPVFSRLATKINRSYLNKFNKIWVLDYEQPDKRLSGQLSDSAGLNIPVKYIGPKSALSDVEMIFTDQQKTDYLILLSGVEPQRTILENILLEKFKDNNQRITLVRGSNSPYVSKSKNITAIDFAFDAELKALILNASIIMCRSGYSTLMDLHLLGKKKLILIPTPGQTEQEYLAAHWQKTQQSISIIQDKIHSYQF